MSVLEQVELMTLDEFIAAYHDEPFELVDGERRLLMPNVLGHQFLIRAIFRLLDAFCIAHALGEVIIEGPFVELFRSQWVKGSRTPDLMFISAARWTQYLTDNPDWEAKPSLLIPDLAVEIISPNDRFGEVQDKVDEYLRKGVRLIWVFDPERQRVHVYQGDRHQTLEKTETLNGSDVLPGFEVPLTELFISIK